jgi:hypothetical protein
MSEIIEKGRARAARIETVLRPIVDRVPAEHQRLLIAFLERNAAQRYREWASEAADEAERQALHACAAREEEIATQIEGMTSNAAEVQESLLVHVPALRSGFDSVFGNASRREQMAIQAAAERLGAGVWRGFAAAETDQGNTSTLERCARLEEESAACLERMLG